MNESTDKGIQLWIKLYEIAFIIELLLLNILPLFFFKLKLSEWNDSDRWFVFGLLSAKREDILNNCF